MFKNAAFLYGFEQSCEWNDKSMNREPESTTRIGPDASFFIRISKSTLTFEFRTISFSSVV